MKLFYSLALFVSICFFLLNSHTDAASWNLFTPGKGEENKNPIDSVDSMEDKSSLDDDSAEVNTEKQSSEDQYEPKKISIEDDNPYEEIKTVDNFGGEAAMPGSSRQPQLQHQPQPQPQTQLPMSPHQVMPYGDPGSSQAQQSPFVDNVPYPTESQGPDPRFARPRQCQEDQYLCQKASPQQEHIRCIPNSWKCNGVRDCENNDDEEGCAVNVHRARVVCSPNQYTCENSGLDNLPVICIDLAKVCDGQYDCYNGADESNCPAKPRELAQDQRQAQRPMQSAPSHLPYSPQEEYPQQPSVNCPVPTRSEEYIKRLEWVDRCIRSCIAKP